MKVTVDLSLLKEERKKQLQSGEMVLGVFLHAPGSLEQMVLLDEARIETPRPNYFLIEGDHRNYLLNTKEFQMNATQDELTGILRKETLDLYCQRGFIVPRRACTELVDSFGKSIPFLYHVDNVVSKNNLRYFFELENRWALQEGAAPCEEVMAEYKYDLIDFPVNAPCRTDQVLVMGHVIKYDDRKVIYPNSALTAAEVASLLGYTKSYVGNGNLRGELMMKVLQGERYSMGCMGFHLEKWMREQKRPEYKSIYWTEF